MGSWYKRLRKRIAFLGPRMRVLVQEAWDDRHSEDTSPLDNFFGTGIVGYVDSFPIYVRRPASAEWQAALYQGKYHSHVVKIQGVCNVRGVPIFISGPHAGTSADINLFRDFGPPLTGDDVVLGDKAYCDKKLDTVIAPFKKTKGGALTLKQKDYNKVHSWYRATIEHVFGQFKKFQVLASVYRGQIHKDNGKLECIVSIISGILVLQVRARPLRRHLALLDAEDDKQFAEEADARRDADEKRGRLFVDGFPIGDDKKDILVGADGSIVGSGAEPDDSFVDSGFAFSDFAVGDRVLVYWWGLWWSARVQYVAVRAQTITFRWEWSNNVTKGWPSRLVHRLRDV